MAGKIQNADVKSLTELTGLGATKTQLLNTDKMYSPKTDNVLETDLRKNNDAATTDPAVGNDSTQNYEVGSRWINTTTGKTFICNSNAAGAAVWKEQINKDSTQSLSNKTLLSPSIQTPSRADVKQDTLANLTTYAATASNGQLCFATDTKTMYQIIDGALTLLTGTGGVGGVDILATDTAEQANLTDYTQTGLEIISSPIILHGSKSLRLVHQAATTYSFKKIIPVDRKFRGKVMTFEIDNVSSAQMANCTILFKDETNNANIGTSQQIQTNSQTITASTTINTTTLNAISLSDFNKLKLGMLITGPGIPTGTRIDGLNPSTLSATLSQNATSSTSGTKSVSSLTTKRKFSFTIPEGCASLSYTVSALPEANSPESYFDDIILYITQTLNTTAAFTVPKNNNYSGQIVSGITIGATTTAPTKGTTVTDRIIHSRFENRLIADYQFEMSSAGVNGSGDYLFTLPNSLQFDSSIVNFNTSSAQSTNAKCVVGFGEIGRTTGTENGKAILVAYDSTRFRVIVDNIAPAASSAAATFFGSAWFGLASTNIGWTFHLDAPIAGWNTNETTTTQVPLTSSIITTTPDSQMSWKGFAGLGSARTKIPYFTNPKTQTGGAFSWTTSTTNGLEVTALEDGFYIIEFFATWGINVNDAIAIGIDLTDFTTNPISRPTDTTIVKQQQPSAISTTRDGVGISWSGPLKAGQKIYPMLGINPGDYASLCEFSVAKIGSSKIINPSSDQKIEIPTHNLRFEGATTRGSTNTAVVKFNTSSQIKGDAWTVNNTAASGTEVTMKKAGRLTVQTTLYLPASGQAWITKNKQILTSTPPADNENFGSLYSTAANMGTITNTFDVVVGDIIRICANANPNNELNLFTLNLQEQSVAVALQNVQPNWDNGDSEICLWGSNGTGSTNTRVARFLNLSNSIGSAVTYTDSATLGGSFLINETGLYDISLIFQIAGGTEWGTAYIMKNQADATGTNDSANENILGACTIASATQDISMETTSVQKYLVKGDVIRAVRYNTSGSPVISKFTISKVGKTSGTVDVTPFVNGITAEETQSVIFNKIAVNGNFTSVAKNTNTGLLSFNSTTGIFTVLKKCQVWLNVASINATLQVRNTVQIFIDEILVAQDTSDTASNNTSCTANWSQELEVGQTFRLAQSGSNDLANASVFARTMSNSITTPTQQVSSDTMSFVFKSTAIDPNTDPIGTFNTYSKSANSQTSNVLSATAPSQSISSMNTSGILISPTNYATASSANLPSRFDIFIGKGLDSWEVAAFDAINKGGNELALDMFPYNAAEQYGIIKVYNKTTGILTLDSAGIVSSSVTVRAFLRKTYANSSPNGYFTFAASKTPSLVSIPNLNQRVAFLKDLKVGGNTTGGASVAGVYQTRVLNTLEDTDGIVTSLASNQFTLPAGTYLIEASAPCYGGNAHKIRVRNITDSTTPIAGTKDYCQTNTQGTSFASGKITINSNKTFEIQHWIAVANGTEGLGVINASGGDDNVFTQVKITKIK